MDDKPWENDALQVLRPLVCFGFFDPKVVFFASSSSIIAGTHGALSGHRNLYPHFF